MTTSAQVATPDQSSAVDTHAAEPNPVHDLHSRLHHSYAEQYLKSFEADTPALACLKQLLQALDWTGEARHLEEALPHFDKVTTTTELRALLTRLNYHTEPRRMRLCDIPSSILPALFEIEDTGAIHVILALEPDGSLLVFDSTRNEFGNFPASRTNGTLYRVTPIDRQDAAEATRKYGWLQALFKKFRHTILTLFIMTFAINLLALAVPVYVMNVYDKAIGAKSPMTLFYFLSGILILVALEFALRNVRSRAIAFLGAPVRDPFVYYRLREIAAYAGHDDRDGIDIGPTDTAQAV